MILHIATFDFVEGVSVEEVAELTTALERMAQALPQLRLYRCGANLHLRPGGAAFGVVAVVDDADALEAYLGGPEHAAVLERYLRRMTAGRHAVQLEVTPEALATAARAGNSPGR